MPTLFRLGLVSVLILSSGCTGNAYRAAPVLHYAALGPDGRRPGKVGPLDLDAYTFPDRSDQKAIVLAAGDKAYRNRLQNTLMLRSNEICDVVNSQILAYSNNANLSTGFVSTVLSGAAAVVTGSIVKSALAAGAGVGTGTRSLINEEIYRGKFVQVILDAMARSRREKAAIIRAKWALTVSEYGLEESILDAVEYHDMCSFHNGVTLLSNAIERATPCDRLREQQKAILQDIDVYSDVASPGVVSDQTADVADAADSEDSEAGDDSTSTRVVSAGDETETAPVANSDSRSAKERYSTKILEARWKQLERVELQLSACLPE